MIHPIGPEPRGPCARLIPVPRPDGGLRWLTELAPGAAAAFAGAVAPLVSVIEPRLGPRVVANRVVGPSLALEPWRRAHARWRRRVDTGMGEPGVRSVLKADVRDCYASVTGRAIAIQLRRQGLGAREVRTLMLLLGRFEEDGVRGLPVGPDPSAVLANIVLQHVDEALAATGARHLRWVDDIVVFARHRPEADAAQGTILRSLEELGLCLNESKSAVLTDHAAANAAVGGGRISPAPRSCVR